MLGSRRDFNKVILNTVLAKLKFFFNRFRFNVIELILKIHVKDSDSTVIYLPNCVISTEHFVNFY